MKTFTLRLLTGFLFLVCISNGYAQNGPVITAVQGKLIRTTPPLDQIDKSNMYGVPLRITRSGDGFAGGINDPERAEETIHRNIKKNTDAAVLSNGFTPTPEAPTSTINKNFDGQVFPNFAPSDNNVAVGPNHVIQIINHSSGSAFKIWDKAGNVVQNSTVLSTITGVTGGGDPVVLYDQLADRWVLTEFGFTGGVTSYINTLIIAVSTSSNPTGSWKVYSYTVNDNGTNYFVDYPKYAVWPNAYYATSNDFNTAGTSYLGSSIYAFDRTAMLAGAATATMVRTRLNNASQRYYSMAPVCQEGMATSNQSGLFAFIQDNTWVSGTTSDSIYTFEFTPNFANPASSVVSPFKQLKSNLAFNTNISNLSQPRPGGSIQALSERLMNKVIYRNFGSYESIVCNTTDLQGTGTGVHWWELRRTGGAGNWSIYQEGFYHPDNNNRFMGSIAINANGDIGLLYNVVSGSVYPSARFTGRSSCDPLGQMTLAEQVIQNGSTYEGNNRYGDYNSLSVDQSNGSFWGTAQYNASGAGTYGNWKTRIVNFTLTSSCGGGCTGVGITTQPSNSTVCTGTNTSFSVVVTGTSPNYQWQVSTNGCNGSWSDLTNTPPYSGVTTATLTITAPNTALSGNVYRVVVSNSCPSTINSSCATLTVNPNVSAGTVSGSSPVCIGNTPTYTVSNATSGGTWSSTNTNVATVNSSGVVTAVGQGTTNIIYTVNSGCGSPVSSFQTLTVNPNVSAGTVSGTSPVCVGATPTYSSNGTSGGTWSSSNASVATVDANGVVTAVSSGTANIIYTVNDGCGSPISGFQTITVTDDPTAGTVSGTSPLCINQTTTYTSDGTPGGSWSSSNTLVATVNSTTGLVTAVGTGTADIVYTVTACNGDPITASQSITVTDCAPTISCPGNIETSTTSGCSKSVTTPDPSVNNATSLTWVLSGATTGSGSGNVGTRNFNIGVTTITYTASNASGSANCSFTVKVNDNTPATITCPANINNQQNGMNKCSATIATPNPNTSGNCNVTNLVWSMSGPNGTSSGSGFVGTQTFPVGITNITYTVTNGAGNTTSCTFTVTVRNTKCPNNPPAVHGNNGKATPNADNLVVQVFPNPSETYFTLLVQSSKTENVEISVYTVSGKLVQRLKGSASDIFRFGDNYIAGAYIVKVQQGNKQSIVKVVK